MGVCLLSSSIPSGPACTVCPEDSCKGFLSEFLLRSQLSWDPEPLSSIWVICKIPGSDTIYAANVIVTTTYTFWRVDFLAVGLSLGIVGGRVIWVLRKNLEIAGRNSNSAKDVRNALLQVFFLS